MHAFLSLPWSHLFCYFGTRNDQRAGAKQTNSGNSIFPEIQEKKMKTVIMKGWCNKMYHRSFWRTGYLTSPQCCCPHEQCHCTGTGKGHLLQPFKTGGYYFCHWKTASMNYSPQIISRRSPSSMNQASDTSGLSLLQATARVVKWKALTSQKQLRN